MAFPENKLVELPQNPAGTVVVGVGTTVEVRQMMEKGYDFTRGAGAGFTAVLEGSVRGQNWTTIVNLNASGQGAISGHYNLVRANVSVGGALGTGTELYASGKII